MSAGNGTFAAIRCWRSSSWIQIFSRWPARERLPRNLSTPIRWRSKRSGSRGPGGGYSSCLAPDCRFWITPCRRSVWPSMSERRPAVTIEPARREEMAAAFRLLFQHLGENDRETRVANALKMLRDKELQATGMLVARADKELRGALFYQPVAGASGLIWPPQTEPERTAEVEDQLVNCACRRLAEQGAKLVQSLLSPEESSLGASLERNGFSHITQLRYLRHDLQFSPRFFQSPEAL